MNDFWQENKRLLTIAGSGLLVFLIGWLVVDGLYASAVRTERRNVTRLRSQIEKERYSVQDRDQAQAENDALRAALGALRLRAEFAPRPEFRLPANLADAGQHYFGAVEEVRERLAVAAGRRRVVLPQGLGLEMIDTNSADTFERHLAALDLLDRVLTLAIENDVKQVRAIKIDLDPAFRTRRGLGPVEETSVEIDVISTPDTITDWLVATQTNRFGQPLPIRSAEARSARAKTDELRQRVTFSVVRLHLPEDLELEGGVD